MRSVMLVLLLMVLCWPAGGGAVAAGVAEPDDADGGVSGGDRDGDGDFPCARPCLLSCARRSRRPGESARPGDSACEFSGHPRQQPHPGPIPGAASANRPQTIQGLSSSPATRNSSSKSSTLVVVVVVTVVLLTVCRRLRRRLPDASATAPGPDGPGGGGGGALDAFVFRRATPPGRASPPGRATPPDRLPPGASAGPGESAGRSSRAHGGNESITMSAAVVASRSACWTASRTVWLKCSLQPLRYSKFLTPRVAWTNFRMTTWPALLGIAGERVGEVRPSIRSPKWLRTDAGCGGAGDGDGGGGAGEMLVTTCLTRERRGSIHQSERVRQAGRLSQFGRVRRWERRGSLRLSGRGRRAGRLSQFGRVRRWCRWSRRAPLRWKPSGRRPKSLSPPPPHTPHTHTTTTTRMPTTVCRKELRAHHV